jgi:1,4-dihydroxy-2-naphthoyl-CoA synthase
MLSSRVLHADEALAIGLVHAVHPADELLDRTIAYARDLIDTTAPSSLRAIKAQLGEDLFGSLRDSDAESIRLIGQMVTSPDFARAMEVFSQRRPPAFAAHGERTLRSAAEPGNRRMPAACAHDDLDPVSEGPGREPTKS